MARVVSITTSLTEQEVIKLDRKARELEISRAALLRAILRGRPTVLNFPRDVDHPQGLP